jgi:hypothetical protein
MTFSDPTPVWGDTDNVLLFKICQMANDQISMNHPPELGDSDNNLLFKLALIFSGN